MATPDFPFVPDWNAAISVEPRISKVDFGDGYAQRVGKGLNTMLETVSVSFSGRTDAEAAEIKAFFDERGGCVPFTARIGFGSPIKKYVTDGAWELTLVQYNDNTITATFQEVP